MSAPMLMSRPRPSRQVNPFSRYMRKSHGHEDKSRHKDAAADRTKGRTEPGWMPVRAFLGRAGLCGTPRRPFADDRMARGATHDGP